MAWYNAIPPLLRENKALVDIEGLLPRVSKPARYTGGELESIRKDWDCTDVAVREHRREL